MIASLRAINPNCFHGTIEKGTTKWTLGRESLLLKMEEFRSKMALCNQKTNEILQQQKTMHQTAARIESKQAEMRFAIKSVEQKVTKIHQVAKSINKKQELVLINFTSIFYIFDRLAKVAFSIQQNQKAIEIVLNNVLKQKNGIQQHAIRIQNNGAVIEQNLLLAGQKVEKVSQQAQEIEKDRHDIKIKALEMEEKKEKILEQARQMEEIFKQTQKYQSILGIKGKAQGTSVWSSMLSQMNVLCSWLVLEVGVILKIGKEEINSLLSSRKWVNVTKMGNFVEWKTMTARIPALMTHSPWTYLSRGGGTLFLYFKRGSINTKSCRI